MYKQKTDELEEILEKTHPSQIESYIENCTDEMLTEGRDFMRYMNEKFKEKKLRKQDVLLRADISQGYGYKLLTEEKVTKQRKCWMTTPIPAVKTMKRCWKPSERN